MWQFLKDGGPIMFLLIPTSIVGLTFIIERGLALRWKKVIPPEVEKALDLCRNKQDLTMLHGICHQQPAPLSRLLLVAMEHLNWPKGENQDAIQTRARHEVARMERGLVVLEIVVGIAPLLGLVGTINGLISLFGGLSHGGLGDNTAVAHGISIALNATLSGLLIAIPALIAWSYYSKKVETHLYLGPRPVTQDKLEQELKTGAATNPRLRISVRPDDGAPIGQLVKVMDAAKAAGIKDVSMFTRPAPARQLLPPGPLQ